LSLFIKPFEKIVLEDIESLIENQVNESRHMDYKVKLPGNTDSEKTGFLEDVTAMANSGGGDIIYGIGDNENNKDKRYSLSGISTENVDRDKRRLESIIRVGIEPRILYYNLKEIEIKDSNYLFLLRIYRSMNTPHMITFKGKQRFYARNSAGKHPMDINELRSSFLTSSTYQEQAKNWRLERLSVIKSNESFVPLQQGAKIVLHLIPLQAVNIGQAQDIKSMYSEAYKSFHKYFYYNLEGLLGLQSDNDDFLCNYTQIFRTTSIECISDSSFYVTETRRQIPLAIFEVEIIKTIKAHLNYLKQISITPPFAIGISLLDLKGYELRTESHDWRYQLKEPKRFSQEDILLPNIILNDFNEEITKTLKPAFDIAWNACGLPGSENYNQDGNWKRQE